MCDETCRKCIKKNDVRMMNVPENGLRFTASERWTDGEEVHETKGKETAERRRTKI